MHRYLMPCNPTTAGWEPIGPPHKQRYLSYTPADAAAATSNGNGAAAAAAATEAPAAEVGRRLADVKRGLFESRAFGKLLRAFTTIDMLGHAGEVRRMRPGERGHAWETRGVVHACSCGVCSSPCAWIRSGSDLDPI